MAQWSAGCASVRTWVWVPNTYLRAGHGDIWLNTSTGWDRQARQWGLIGHVLVSLGFSEWFSLKNKNQKPGWVGRDDSAVESSWCACRGPGFHFQHSPYTPPPISSTFIYSLTTAWNIPVLGGWLLSLDLCGLLHACGAHPHPQACTSYKRIDK